MTDRLTAFKLERQRVYRDLSERWPGVLADPYDLLAPHVVEPRDAAELFSAARDIGRIYAKAARLLCALPVAALARLGCSPRLHSCCTLASVAYPAVFARLDLARTADGVKLLDFNADFPGLLFEAAVVNAHAPTSGRLASPHRRAQGLMDAALFRAIEHTVETRSAARRKNPVVRCVFSKHMTEHRAQALYLAAVCSARYDTRAIPLQDVAVNGSLAYDELGARIDVMVRCCSLRALVEPWDVSRRTGAKILDLVVRRRLALINSATAHVLESKAVQAFIWGLHMRRLFFNRHEHTVIGRHFLPTFFRPDGRWTRWVEKPFLESSGVGVKIHARRHRRVTARPEHVYQKYIPLPREPLLTELGPRRLTTVVSCVLAAGRPVALIMRAGRTVTDEFAWNVPVAIGPTTDGSSRWRNRR